ncbi:MAG: hypothetical protein AB9856_20940 [Cellulosilyticaceae bacterium]
MIKKYRILIVLIATFLVGCGDKGISLEEYIKTEAVENFSVEMLHMTQNNVEIIDENLKVDIGEFNNLNKNLKSYENIYKELKNINIEELSKEASELHNLYLNYGYYDINQYKYYLNAASDLVNGDGLSVIESMDKSNELADKAFECKVKISEYYK